MSSASLPNADEIATIWSGDIVSNWHERSQRTVRAWCSAWMLDIRFTSWTNS